jgi:hypothetical protein
MIPVLDWLAIALCVIGYGIVKMNYSLLPARIPIHFGFSGQADGWGPRRSIWLLPVLSIVMYVALSAAAWAGAPSAMALMMSLLKLEMMGLFLFVVRGQISVALGHRQRLGMGVWLWILASIVTPLVVLPIMHR